MADETQVYFDAEARERIRTAVRAVEGGEFAGVGNVFGMIRALTGIQLELGKTAASHAKGDFGTINKYRGRTKGEETDSGETIENVYNRFADLESGKWVICIRWKGSWELLVGECT